MDRNGHLLVVTTNHVETHGGVQAHLMELLPRLAERGLAVTVAYLGERDRPFVESGVVSVPLRRRVDVREVIGLPDPRQWRSFVSVVRRGALANGHVTHVATHTRFFPMSALGVHLGRRLGVPVVHTEHGAGSVVTGSGVIELGSRAVDASMGRWVLRQADTVVAVSEQTRHFVRELAGVDSVRIPNGIDVGTWWSPGPAPTFGEGASRPLVFVGRLVAEKGWLDFLTVASAARDRLAGQQVPVHVVGDGPELELARREAAARGIEVSWHGRLGPADIAPLLRGGVYVNPSVAAEGFQLTQLEALVAGAAVITYDVGVATELSASGVGQVCVVERGDSAALAAAATDALVTAPQPVTRAEVERWDWATIAEDYAAVLSSATVRGRASR